MQAIENELRFVFITSEAVVKAGNEISISVVKNEDAKCVRCWHQRPEVGAHSDHPELCGRCIENIDGSGETRHYA